MSERLRLLALASAPVFYQAPLYRQLAKHPAVELCVVYASSGGVRQYDAGFGHPVSWDIDVLGGYEHTLLRRAARNNVRGGFFALRDWDAFLLILRGDYDVLWVHSCSYLTTWLAMTAAWVRGMPVLLREEQTLFGRRSWPKRWIRAAVLFALFKAVYGLSVGSANRAYFRRYGMAKDRIFFVPYCVDNEALRDAAAALRPRREELRHRFGIAQDAGPVIVVVAKLVAGKGLGAALSAFASVRARHRCALLIVGDGELRQELERRVIEDGIPDVRFAGFLNRSEISGGYAAADVFLLPSRSDTWGMVVNEAMNFSLPLVLTDRVGSAADLLRDGENGFAIRVDDERAMAHALETLVADAALRSRFGARSAELVAAWSLEIACDGVVRACYAATRRPAPASVASPSPTEAGT